MTVRWLLWVGWGWWTAGIAWGWPSDEPRWPQPDVPVEVRGGVQLGEAQGQVEVRPARLSEWVPVRTGELAFAGDLFRTRGGGAVFVFPDGGQLHLSAEATVEFRQVGFSLRKGEWCAVANEVVVWKGEVTIELGGATPTIGYRLRTREWELLPTVLPLRARLSWEQEGGGWLDLQAGALRVRPKGGASLDLAAPARFPPASIAMDAASGNINPPVGGFLERMAIGLPDRLWQDLDPGERASLAEAWQQWSEEERRGLASLPEQDWQHIRALARVLRCQRNLRTVGDALRRYLAEHDEILPPAGQEWQVLEPYRPAGAEWRCPYAPAGERGLAWNPAWAGWHRAQLLFPEVVPLLYDADANGAPVARHGRALNALLADGRVVQLTVPLSPNLQWRPEGF